MHLFQQMAAWLDHSSPVPLVHLLSELSHSATLVVAIHSHTSFTDDDTVDRNDASLLHCSPLLLAALLTVRNASSLSSSTANMDTDAPPFSSSFTLQPSLARFLGSWAAHSGDNWSETVCRVCESTLHASTPTHALGLARVALRFLSQPSSASSSTISDAASGSRKKSRKSIMSDQNLPLARDPAVLRFMARLQQFLGNKDGSTMEAEHENVECLNDASLVALPPLACLSELCHFSAEGGAYPIAHMDSAGVGHLVENLRAMEPRRLPHALAAFRSHLHFMLLKISNRQHGNSKALTSQQPLKKIRKSILKTEATGEAEALVREDVTTSPEWAAVTVLLAFVRRLLVLILEQATDQIDLVREAAAVLFDSDQTDSFLALCVGDTNDASSSTSSPQLRDLVTSRVVDLASLFYNAYQQHQQVKSGVSKGFSTSAEGTYVNFATWCSSQGLCQLAAQLLRTSSSTTFALFSGDEISDALHAMIEAAPLDDAIAAFHAHSRVAEMNLPLVVALSKRVGQGPAALASLWLQDPVSRSSLCAPLLHALDQSLAVGSESTQKHNLDELLSTSFSSSSQPASRPSTTTTVWVKEAWVVCGDDKLVAACWSRLEALVSRLMGGQKQSKKDRNGATLGAATTDDASCLGGLVHAVRQHRASRNAVAALISTSLLKASQRSSHSKDSLHAQVLIFVALPLIQQLVTEGDAPLNLASSALQCVLPILLSPELPPWLHKKLLLAAWRSVPNDPLENKRVPATPASLDSLTTCFTCVENMAKVVAGNAMSGGAQNVLQLVVSCVGVDDYEDSSEKDKSAEMEDDEEAEEGSEEDDEEDEGMQSLTDSQLRVLLAMTPLLCTSTPDATTAQSHLLPTLLNAVALREDTDTEQRLAVNCLQQLRKSHKKEAAQPLSDTIQASAARVYQALLDPSSHAASVGEEKAASRLSSCMRLLELLAPLCPPQDTSLLQNLCRSTPFLALLSNEVATSTENSATTSPARLLCVACKVLSQGSSSSSSASEGRIEREDLEAVQSSNLLQKLMAPYGASCSKSDSERLATLAALRRHLPTLPLAPHDLAPGGSSSVATAVAAAPGSASKSANEAPFEWFFDLFTGAKIAATLEHFPTRRGFFPTLTMSEDGGNKSSDIGDVEDQTDEDEGYEEDDEDEDEEDRWEAPFGEGDSNRLYDPAFVLPLLVAALAYARQQVFEFPTAPPSQEGDSNASSAHHRQRAANAARLLQACAECGVLSIAFAALSSARLAMRAAAAACLEHVDVLLNRAFSLEARNRSTSSSGSSTSVKLSSDGSSAGNGASADSSSSNSAISSGSSSTLKPALTAEVMQGASLLVRCRLQLAAVVHAAQGTLVTALAEAQEHDQEEDEEERDAVDGEVNIDNVDDDSSTSSDDDDHSGDEESNDDDSEDDENAVALGAVEPQAKKSKGQTPAPTSSMIVPRLPHMHALFLAKACLYAGALSAPRNSASTTAFFVRSKRHSGYSGSLPPPGLSLAVPVLSAVAQLPTGLRYAVSLL